MWRCCCCNADFDAPVGKCDRCGSEDVEFPARITISDGKNAISVHKGCDLGRDAFRPFEMYRYVSDKQLALLHDGKGWRIMGYDHVANPTCLNNEDITGKERPLNAGDVLLVGNPRTGKGLQATVAYEWVKAVNKSPRGGNAP